MLTTPPKVGPRAPFQLNQALTGVYQIHSIFLLPVPLDSEGRITRKTKNYQAILLSLKSSAYLTLVIPLKFSYQFKRFVFSVLIS